MADAPLRDAGLAISLLTVVPTGARMPEQGGTQSAAYFPLAGAVPGVLLWALAHLAEKVGVVPHAPYVVAALLVTAAALSTRLLHFDGLADVADGFWGGHEPARRLEIMSDSATGAFGASAVALVALLEVSAVGAVLSASRLLVLLAVPMLARFAATCAAWLGTPARPGGLGRSVIARPTALSLVVGVGTVSLVTGALVYAYGPLGGVGAGLGVLLALGVPHVIAQRFGGVTGDVMGASVLITEALLFAFFALAA